MLTWAVMWFAKDNNRYQINGITLLITVCGDVAIFNALAGIIK